MKTDLLEVALAGLNVNSELRDAIVGDLVEERTELAAVRGERFSDGWMSSQVLRSVPSLAMASLRDGGARTLARIMVAAGAAMLGVMALISLSMAAVFNAVPAQAIARFAVILLVVDLAYGLAGGYLAARLGRSAPLPSAVAFGVLAIIISGAATSISSSCWVICTANDASARLCT